MCWNKQEFSCRLRDALDPAVVVYLLRFKQSGVSHDFPFQKDNPVMGFKQFHHFFPFLFNSPFCPGLFYKQLRPVADLIC